MEMTTTGFLTRLVYDIDVDDVDRELEPVSVGRRQEIWEEALELVASEMRMRYRVIYILQVLGALSKDHETSLRSKTKKALEAILNPDERDRRSIQRILAQFERREEKMMTFRRYQGIACLVKYGNMYKARTERKSDWQIWHSLADGGKAQPTSHDDEAVEWLIRQGLADRADYDPAACLGKVIPTAKAAARLKDDGLTVESPGVGAHIGHCCLMGRHGCKYCDEFCPVVTKRFPPESERCGACYEDDYMTDEALGHYSDDELAGELVSRGYTVTDPKDEKEEDGADAEG